MKFTISTDSCCDHLRSYLEKNKIHYIILKRITNGVASEELYDSNEEFETFYEQIKRGALPTTSLLNEFELSSYFSRVLDECEGDIVHVPLSSGLSGTCQNAVAAAEKLNETLTNRKIYVVDSLSATRGMAMQVDRLIEMREAGLRAEEAVKRLVDLRDHQHLWSIIADLNHLKRGGRISGFKSAVGTLLKVSPIMIINAEGRLAIEKTVKGDKKSIDYILHQMDKYGAKADKNFSAKTVYLISSGDCELVHKVEAAIKEKFPAIKIDRGMIGPIVGTHVGAGSVGIFFEGAKRLKVGH